MTKENEQFNKKYASIYDLLYLNKDYKKEVRFLTKIFTSKIRNIKSIFDFGCGSGVHGAEFVKNGFLYTGFDASEHMIIAANERFKRINQELYYFSKADITKKIAYSKLHDVGFSLFHVFSYINTSKEARVFFRNAAALLKHKGLFLFDFWNANHFLKESPKTVIKRFQNNTFHITRITEPEVDYYKNLAKIKFTFFVNELNDKIWSFEEVHMMRYWFEQEIIQLASEHFDFIDSFNWFDLNSKVDHFDRVILLQKK